MFALAYVILPFCDTMPAAAIEASLARFRRGLRGDVPDDWLEFDDCTGFLRSAHEANFVFTLGKDGRLGIQGGNGKEAIVNLDKVRNEMRRTNQIWWRVRFADVMDLDAFHDEFCERHDRNPETEGFGIYRNGLGRWDWWDLGGRFDGCILSESRRTEGRGAASLQSPGKNTGRSILRNLERILGETRVSGPSTPFDISNDRNVELVSMLLADARAGEGNAFPAVLVLPPGAAEDRLRWIDSWPQPGASEGIDLLGLAPEASWDDVVEAVYARFEDHWAAGISYHF